MSYNKVGDLTALRKDKKMFDFGKYGCMADTSTDSKKTVSLDEGV